MEVWKYGSEEVRNLRKGADPCYSHEWGPAVISVSCPSPRMAFLWLPAIDIGRREGLWMVHQIGCYLWLFVFGRRKCLWMVHQIGSYLWVFVFGRRKCLWMMHQIRCYLGLCATGRYEGLHMVRPTRQNDILRQKFENTMYRSK